MKAQIVLGWNMEWELQILKRLERMKGGVISVPVVLKRTTKVNLGSFDLESSQSITTTPFTPLFVSLIIEQNSSRHRYSLFW